MSLSDGGKQYPGQDQDYGNVVQSPGLNQLLPYNQVPADDQHRPGNGARGQSVMPRRSQD